MNTRKNQGFTLIELLVVMGILAVLLAITLIAVNPARQFAQARDAKRANDVRQLLNAIHAYIADNKGTIPTQITVGGTLAVMTIQSGSANTIADVCSLLVPNYIPALPEDPTTGANGGKDVTTCSSYNTGYTLVRDEKNRITISTMSEVNPSASIAVSR